MDKTGEIKQEGINDYSIFLWLRPRSRLENEKTPYPQAEDKGGYCGGDNLLDWAVFEWMNSLKVRFYIDTKSTIEHLILLT